MAFGTSGNHRPCHTQMFHPCINTQCIDHAHCHVTVADCDFENQHTCGWASQLQFGEAGFTLTTTTSKFGPTEVRKGSSGSAYMLAMETKGFLSHTLTSKPHNEFRNGNCQLNFWAAVGNDLTELDVQVSYEAAADDGKDVWTSVLKATTGTEVGAWSQYSTPFNGEQMVTFRFGTMLASSNDYLAIDDVSVSCEVPDAKDGSAATNAVQFGSCQCDLGYKYMMVDGAPTCLPTILQALTTDSEGRFVPLLKVLSESKDSNFDQMSVCDPPRTFLAPVKSAFQAPKLSTSEYDKLVVPYDDSKREFFRVHMMKKNYPASSLNLVDLGTARASKLLTLGGRYITVTGTQPLKRFDNATVIGEIQTCSGSIYVMDSVLQKKFTRSPDRVEICGDCDANAECVPLRQESGCDGGCFQNVIQAQCADCVNENLGKTTNVCGTTTGNERKSYLSKCLAECDEATITDEKGACQQSTCVCNKNEGWVGSGFHCSKLGLTTTMPTTRTTVEPVDQHLMPEIFFYMNGSYQEVVGGRSAMRDGFFNQNVRESFENASDITAFEGQQLGVECFPSARMPGYILIRVAGYGMEAALERVSNAVDSGQVGLYFEHEDAFRNSAALQRTYFKAWPRTDLLPPIIQYMFVVDTNYRKEVCRPNNVGVCQNEFLNQEQLIAAIRWSVEFELEQKQAAQDMVVYMWPEECKRKGVEGQVEVLATAFYYNAKHLLAIRAAVEDGSLTVFGRHRKLTGDTNELIARANPLPYDQRDVDKGVRPTAEASMKPYPGYFGTSVVDGRVSVWDGDSVGQIYLKYDLVGVGPSEVAGIHIHEGATCDNAGGHYWGKASIKEDPWLQDSLKYKSFSDGSVSGTLAVVLGVGLDSGIASGPSMRTVVVHNEQGTRIGCGVLKRRSAVFGAGTSAQGPAAGVSTGVDRGRAVLSTVEFDVGKVAMLNALKTDAVLAGQPVQGFSLLQYNQTKGGQEIYGTFWTRLGDILQQGSYGRVVYRGTWGGRALSPIAPDNSDFKKEWDEVVVVEYTSGDAIAALVADDAFTALLSDQRAADALLDARWWSMSSTTDKVQALAGPENVFKGPGVSPWQSNSIYDPQSEPDKDVRADYDLKLLRKDIGTSVKGTVLCYNLVKYVKAVTQLPIHAGLTNTVDLDGPTTFHMFLRRQQKVLRKYGGRVVYSGVPTKSVAMQFLAPKDSDLKVIYWDFMFVTEFDSVEGLQNTNFDQDYVDAQNDFMYPALWDWRMWTTQSPGGFGYSAASGKKKDKQHDYTGETAAVLAISCLVIVLAVGHAIQKRMSGAGEASETPQGYSNPMAEASVARASSGGAQGTSGYMDVGARDVPAGGSEANTNTNGAALTGGYMDVTGTPAASDMVSVSLDAP